MNKTAKENALLQEKIKELRKLVADLKRENVCQAEEILMLRFENIELERKLRGEGDFSSLPRIKRQEVRND